ncbi:equilibrative nucleoside transporter 4 [Sitodiplosis mosellana]|uniref:equilibrative nucleoside transporter 4 n=1 Tax=Sitodiplosis mosellana TaxID=263140 RepID=UPI0024452396|nr:equilibrative nucleoside transporter 4 [Sitodiplosis mosellana]XP_055301921.1 equilibrative nucleoside transporter 4 [Sitodiplosis mosellana]
MMDMEAHHQESTYEPLEGHRPPPRNRLESTDSPDVETSPPQDRNGILYIALIAAGIGFVLPYNSFIMASDYWQERFPGHSVALDMSMTYIIVAFATVLLNNLFLSFFSFKVRIIFGYAVSLSTLVFVALCEVAFHMFSAQTAYSVNLVAVSLTAIGCTIQQSSFYGFASMFPKKYTQAVMAGESLAGLLVASTRISIKLVISSDEVSTVVFFLTSTIYIAFSYVLHSTTIHSPFVRYHMKACCSSKIILRPDEDRVLSDLMEDSSALNSKYNAFSKKPNHHSGRQHYNLNQLDLLTTTTVNSSELGSGSGCGRQTTGLSFSNPVYDVQYELSNPSAGESALLDTLNHLPDSLTAANASTPPPSLALAGIVSDPLPNVAFKVEHVLAPSCSGAGGGNRRFGSFRSGLDSRWRVAQAIYPYMVCIALAYCVTLSLYPGIESEIISCNLKTWMPVLLMFMFNTSDVIGKVMASIPYAWSRRQLILLSTMRISLVPLLLLCCSPRSQPVITGETPAFIFTAALGITNGLAGSLPMMFAPAKVPATLKEATGNMMTLSYNIGLTAGSLIGYVFDSMLGPPIINPCPKFPFIATEAPANITTTTAATTIKGIVSTTLIGSTTTPTTMQPSTMATTTELSTFVAAVATTLASVLTGLTNGNNLTTIEEAAASTISPSPPPISLPLTTAITTAIFNVTATTTTPSSLHN